MSDDSASFPVPQPLPEAMPSPRELIDRLGQVLFASHEGVCEALEILDRLSELLPLRFAEEEKDGHYEDVILQAPWLTATVQQLKGQHHRLQQSLDWLRRDLRDCGNIREVPRDVAQQVSEFVEEYLEHEAGEHNLLQEAFAVPNWALD